jgi:hypothetical protein
MRSTAIRSSSNKTPSFGMISEKPVEMHPLAGPCHWIFVGQESRHVMEKSNNPPFKYSRKIRSNDLFSCRATFLNRPWIEAGISFGSLLIVEPPHI